MKQIKFITTSAELEALVEQLSSLDVIALDTEFMRDRYYYAELCLLQLATRDDDAVDILIIDALALGDIDVFNRLLAEASIEKVIHACRQDVQVLMPTAGPPITSVFDTQIAAAFCGYDYQISYAGLVEDICGVRLEKSQTRTDWSQRPLTQKQIDYVAEDVLYLHEVAEHLKRYLEQKSLTEWCQEETDDVVSQVLFDVDNKDAWQRVKGYQSLPATAYPYLYRIAYWREQAAKTKNMPREWVLDSQTVLDLAFNVPGQLDELDKYVAKLRRRLRREDKQALFDMIWQPMVGDDAIEVKAWEPLTSSQKKRFKRISQVVRDVAAAHGFSPALIANRKMMERAATENTSGRLFSGWRSELLGDQVEQVM